MSALPSPPQNTVALFAAASRNSELVIVPINDGALDKNGSAPAFYCVHSISGTVRADFFDLARRLDSSVRFYGIQAPPRNIQDPSFGRSIESIADHYAEALTKFQPEGPIVLGGYCAGAVVALEMAKTLRLLGREVGPLIVIDGAPENVGPTIKHWQPRYWLHVARNLRGWASHGDLVRNSSLRSWVRSVSKNSFALVRGAIGLRRGQKLGGGYAINGLMDLTPYSPDHRLFIERLFGALFAYVPDKYPLDVVVYEAKITPLLHLPQYGQSWRMFAPRTEIVRILGTHIAMMHEPYVAELAEHMRKRTTQFFLRIGTQDTQPIVKHTDGEVVKGH